jgi:hypothetical protein
MHTDEESRKEHMRRDSGLSLSKEADVKRGRDNLPYSLKMPQQQQFSH